MKPIELTDKSFWSWLSNTEPGSAISEYLRKIRKNQVESGYVLELLKEGYTDHSSSEILDKLSYFMPRRYFLEVDFCAKTYATIFSRVFPPLAARVGELAYTEWLLYTEPGNLRYRDHLIHMFKVAYAGSQLLSMDDLRGKITSCQFASGHFVKWCNGKKLDLPSFGMEERAEIIDLAFFFAALFHDFGYGYYFHRKYQERLFRLYKWILPASDATDTGSEGVQMVLQSLACEFVKNNHAWLRSVNKTNQAFKTLEASVVAGFLHDCLPLNHSIASAFFIIDIAEKLWSAKAINSKLYIALHLAAEAAMIHDMTTEDRWAHLQSLKQPHFLDSDCHTHVPLAILLIFTDELSTWNRYRIKAEWEDNKVTYSMDQNGVPHEINITVSNDTITIQPLHHDYPNLTKDPIAHAFGGLAFLKKSKRYKHLNMMGYKIYVKPRHLR